MCKHISTAALQSLWLLLKLHGIHCYNLIYRTREHKNYLCCLPNHRITCYRSWSNSRYRWNCCFFNIIWSNGTTVIIFVLHMQNPNTLLTKLKWEASRHLNMGIINLKRKKGEGKKKMKGVLKGVTKTVEVERLLRGTWCATVQGVREFIIKGLSGKSK